MSLSGKGLGLAVPEKTAPEIRPGSKHTEFQETQISPRNGRAISCQSTVSNCPELYLFPGHVGETGAWKLEDLNPYIWFCVL
jgi:hypothetical protein